MTRIALSLALVLPLAAGAQEAPPEAPADASGGLCLSDGQVLSGVRIAQDGAHRTVRVGDVDVRVPQDSVATDCSELRVAPTSDPFALRTVTLVDGQRLYGTPLYTPGQMTLALLDEQRIHLPESAVSQVERLDRGPAALEPIHKAKARTQTKRALGIATDVGLGLLGAAAVAGTTWGVVAASRPDE